MISNDRVALTIAEGVAHLRLVRREARNAIDGAMVNALGEAVDACAAASGLRVLRISAEGPAFTVGGDLKYLSARIHELDRVLDEMIPVYHRALGKLASLDVPVVCAVAGAAAGGGLGLAWVSDFLLASEDAVFATGFADLGLSGDGGSSWFLPRLVGLRRAQELILGNRVLRAAEALDWGLVTRVVPRADLEREAEALTEKLAAGPTFCLAEQRRLLRGSWGATLEQQLEAERVAIRRCGATADGREGTSAFVERRKARFDGRGDRS